MLIIWKTLYNYFVIPILWVLLFIYMLFNKKARKAFAGRKNLFTNLEQKIKSLGDSKRIWFHSSSMGEFEQAKPIIAHFKENYPEIKIIVSFFSPSGYENNIKYKLADVITYLPFDTKSKTKKFLDIIKPDLAIFMRYDVWPNLIWELSNRKIPSFLIDATMANNTKRHLPLIKNFHHHIYSCFTEIMTVSDNDKANFLKFNLKNVKITSVGDTRYDQVYIRSQLSKTKNVINPEILKDKKVFIVGSSWKEDEEHIFPAFLKLLEYKDDILMILVPHEPTEKTLELIEEELNNHTSYIRFSYLQNYKNEKIIIIDCIGLLVTLYSYGHIAYVGGGFGSGVHNVLEPAIYGLPVLFGPRNSNSQEAQILKKIGAGIEITNKTEIYKILRKLFDDEELRIIKGKTACEHVLSNKGASEEIIKRLLIYL